MSTQEITRILSELDPAELRQRIAELDRERSALAVLLRAAVARQTGKVAKASPQSPRPEEVSHA